jgi:hypothetical protein
VCVGCTLTGGAFVGGDGERYGMGGGFSGKLLPCYAAEVRLMAKTAVSLYASRE